MIFIFYDCIVLFISLTVCFDLALFLFVQVGPDQREKWGTIRVILGIKNLILRVLILI